MTNRKNIIRILRTLPNKLTIGRIASIPFLLLFYSIDAPFTDLICATLFLAAAFTDFFDGYLARKYKTESALGALLDPIADKLIVTAALVIIASRGDLFGWIVALILCREVGVSGLRLAALEKNYEISVSNFGKAKTLILDAAIFFIFLGQGFLSTTTIYFGQFLIWVALFISYFSAYLYWSDFWKHHKESSEPKVSENTSSAKS